MMPADPMLNDWLGTMIRYLQEATVPTLLLIVIWFAIYKLWPWWTENHLPARRTLREMEIHRDVLASDAQSQLAQAIQRIHETMDRRLQILQHRESAQPTDNNDMSDL